MTKSFSRFPVLILAILSAIYVSAARADEGRHSVLRDPTGFSILEAGEKGMFNMGPAMGDVNSEREEFVNKNVLKFDYTIFSGAIAGVWTKNFPSKLGAKAVDAVRVGVKVPAQEQLRQISVKLEIKGESGVQTIPLDLKQSWNFTQEAVDWDRIGRLREVVFVVSPMDAKKKLDGIVYFDLDFFRLTFLQKYLAFIKFGVCLASSLFLALVAAFLGRLFVNKRSANPPVASSIFSRLKRDLLYGIVAVFILGAAISIYSMGTVSPITAGFSFNFLAIALIGAGIAQILKYGLTGKNLTPYELFQNLIIAGFLAASSSTQELLQSPSSPVQLLLFSNSIAAIFFLIYHLLNARSIASSGKQLRPAGAALVVATPYLFNWLLLVGNPGILQAMGNIMTFGVWLYWSIITENVGRLIVVFGFNEAVTNGISLLTKGRTLKTLKAHIFIFFVSLGVVVAPLIADVGSTHAVATLPAIIKIIVCILTSMLSFAGLWGEVYLITGILLDGGHRKAPSWETISKSVNAGMKKGMAYSGILMAMLFALYMLVNAHLSHKIISSLPILVGIISGSLVFPLIKTIIESFDGSQPFFLRTRYSYGDWTLYARGAVAGFGFSYALSKGMIGWAMPNRILFGLIIGLIASGGISIFRDIVYALRGQGKVQTWRLYFIDSILGAFVGSAAAFYLDSLQVPVVIEKFKLYMSSGFSATEYITYPFVNKWGRINLGSYTGGVKLLYTESLAGVINWSIAAWLFAINKVFMQAYFEKDRAPIKFFFSKAGFATLIEHMLYVLRWGLWMSPIIFTFLRMMPDPTWYNQDGAIHTLFAIFNNVTMSPDVFRQWSLNVFVWLLVYDFFRVLIWMDHMGLRVATLVNLSFLGLDRLDERIARFIGPAAAQRYIPEGVKRFATWAPLLIPFYLPRGAEWDYAWNTSQAMQNANRGKGLLSVLQSLTLAEMALVIGSGILIFTVISFCIRLLGQRSRQRRENIYELGNREYKVVLKGSGEIYSEVIHKECDVSRRSYDPMDPCGRILYLVETSDANGAKRHAWPVVGNFPREKFEASQIKRCGETLKIVNTTSGVRVTVDISLPDEDSTAELWNITIENMTAKPRQLKIVSYLEWVLNGGLHDRFHTQYARLYPEMEYVSSSNAIVSCQKSTKATGMLASDVPPDGFLTSRVNFIGRARSIWSPRILETLDFLTPRDTSPYPTFDPIGSLMVNASLGPNESVTTRLMIGYAKNKAAALDMIKSHLKPQAERRSVLPDEPQKKRALLIGHGEIPNGTPQPYFEFLDNGNRLRVRTPFTPRPVDHTMSNAIHSVIVTNRGLHTSSNGNSQQNRLTPDWPDLVTKEVPTEAIYLYDPDKREWYSPTYHPLNDNGAKTTSDFSVDGTAVFHMERGTLSTELTVFVPPDEPTGIYLLTVKNNAGYARKMRVAPYFQMVLAFQPEKSGPLHPRRDKSTDALLFGNPRNIFRTGCAFVSMSLPAECVETNRGRFFGTGRGVSRPFLVEQGKSDFTQLTDEAQIASFLGNLEIPARGEKTIAIVLGQTDERKEAISLARKYKDVDAAKRSLEATRKWWLGLMETVKVETNSPEFDRFQNWLKYQALAERIWARRGFYQTSGAYGFRDQLQDTVNLIWVDPALARKQIILHASQQFLEGDVFHWFFTLVDGRTAFSCRSHASDNPVWLAWGVVEYIRTVGDYSILDEMTSYVESEFPFAKLPKNKQGWGHLYHRTTRADTVYKHCMRSINLILKDRMGKNGLPLIQTGDWNDGLDEIGSEGRGESVWLGFFLCYILKEMVDIIEKKEGKSRKEYYVRRMDALSYALEKTWRGDRYLRAIHDDGTEIGVKGSGIWEIDALTASWAVTSGINFERGLTIFNTALSILEKDNAILLGWPALREDTKPYLGRSSKYPEGVRENGMYCHGVQWLIRAARVLAEGFEKRGDHARADEYRKTAYRLWLKVSPIPHITPDQIEIYGGQPNKQAADMLTNFEPGRMIWHGYTGAAGWMLRQAFEGVVGASLVKNELILPDDINKPRGELKVKSVYRDVKKSPIKVLRPG